MNATPKGQGMPATAKDSYRVEIDRQGCPHCGAGAQWTVVGPDDYGIGQSFENKEDADDLARLLSAAHDFGRESDKGSDGMDLTQHLARQRAFSENTFGPGTRTAGVVDHIRKELREIEAKPHDLSEWIDVVILAFDGAWRAGYTPGQIAAALLAKQERNEARTWPDWRTAPLDKAIEHVRHGVDGGRPKPSGAVEPSDV